MRHSAYLLEGLTGGLDAKGPEAMISTTPLVKYYASELYDPQTHNLRLSVPGDAVYLAADVEQIAKNILLRREQYEGNFAGALEEIEHDATLLLACLKEPT